METVVPGLILLGRRGSDGRNLTHFATSSDAGTDKEFITF